MAYQSLTRLELWSGDVTVQDAAEGSGVGTGSGRVPHLMVDMARADALNLLSESRRAVELVGRHVRPTHTIVS